MNKVRFTKNRIIFAKNIFNMNELQTIIEQAWENRALLQETTTTDAIREVIELLDAGNFVLQNL